MPDALPAVLGVEPGRGRVSRGYLDAVEAVDRPARLQKWPQMPAFGGRAGLLRRPAVVGAFVGTIAEIPKTPIISMVDGGHIVRHPPPGPL